MVATLTTYEAVVTRGDRYWLVEVPAIGRTTQARHLRELDAMTTDLIEVMTGEAPSEVRYHIELPASVQGHLERAQGLRVESARTQSEAAAEVRAAARELHESGIPLRDIGRVLDVSYQRAHQLVSNQ